MSCAAGHSGYFGCESREVTRVPPEPEGADEHHHGSGNNDGLPRQIQACPSTLSALVASFALAMLQNLLSVLKIYSACNVNYRFLVPAVNFETQPSMNFRI